MAQTESTFILPISNNQKLLVDELLKTFNNQQIIWLSGYLSGLSMAQLSTSAQVQSQIQGGSKNHTEITVLYGSRTGNGENLAKKFKAEAEAKGISIRLEDMNDYSIAKLKDEKYLFVIVSTHGEGEPPVAAEEFYDFIHGKRAPKLNNTKFSVLALGDRSYVHFCKTGVEIDRKLEELGASRIFARTDCDVDFQATADVWTNGVLSMLSASNVSSFATEKPNEQQVIADEVSKIVYTKQNPFKTKVLNKIKLNGRGSDKETTHYEISLENSGFSHEPGDALGVYPVNSSRLVDELIDSLKLNGNEHVNVGDKTITLRDALTYNFELSVITTDVITKYNELAKNEGLRGILTDTAKLTEYIYGRDIVDLTKNYPTNISANELVSVLRKLQPRLYSIASSSKVNADEVHITVSTVRYMNGRYKEGTCSSFLSDRLGEDEEISVYMEKNPEFRLPANSNTPVIMVGPGVGVAPFRSFLQEREINGDAGKNWLIVGDRHFATDFLYQTEFQNFHKKGLLTRLNVAFSRDNNRKVYVQHKMLEHSKELFSWLEEGAHFYVCGDMKNMWRDVNQTLTDIIAREGNLSPDDALDYVKRLKKSKRYQVDVY